MNSRRPFEYILGKEKIAIHYTLLTKGLYGELLPNPQKLTENEFKELIALSNEICSFVRDNYKERGKLDGGIIVLIGEDGTDLPLLEKRKFEDYLDHIERLKQSHPEFSQPSVPDWQI
ncbi:hypothetical protein HYW74_04385 [Candidatus Pacearchaeota archaeon]|nr:hypothetical protein [Candidatus Pacearchaeota archaeon]